MHKLVAVALGAVFALATIPAMAADNAQQDKMKACNTKATGMTGDARKDFMKTCLSGDAAAAPAAPMTQQDKMKACNTKAGDMKGDDRKRVHVDLPVGRCRQGTAPAAAPMTQQEKMKACNTKAGDMKGDDRKKFMSSCLAG